MLRLNERRPNATRRCKGDHSDQNPKHSRVDGRRKACGKFLDCTEAANEGSKRFTDARERAGQSCPRAEFHQVSAQSLPASFETPLLGMNHSVGTGGNRVDAREMMPDVFEQVNEQGT